MNNEILTKCLMVMVAIDILLFIWVLIRDSFIIIERKQTEDFIRQWSQSVINNNAKIMKMQSDLSLHIRERRKQYEVKND